jgi:hypothetical protein
MVKLLREEFRNSLLDGKLYMNPPAYFAELEAGDVVRHDRDEGLSESRQAKEVALQDGEAWIPVQGLIGPLKCRTGRSAKYNMLCLYTFTENSTEPMDDRNLLFGDTYVLIHNMVEFARRFKAAAELANRAWHLGLVEYVDPDVHDGPMGPFRKYHSFNYQNEFRFAIEGDGRALTLDVGDLRDICTWGRSADLNRVFGRAAETATSQS